MTSIEWWIYDCLSNNNKNNEKTLFMSSNKIYATNSTPNVACMNANTNPRMHTLHILRGLPRVTYCNMCMQDCPGIRTKMWNMYNILPMQVNLPILGIRHRIRSDMGIFVNVEIICIYGECTLAEVINWCRVTHTCVSKLIIIGSDNGLSPGRRQAIIWTNAGILLIAPLGINFSKVLIIKDVFGYVVWKMAAILSRSQCVKWNHPSWRTVSLI